MTSYNIAGELDCGEHKKEKDNKLNIDISIRKLVGYRILRRISGVVEIK